VTYYAPAPIESFVRPCVTLNWIWQEWNPPWHNDTWLRLEINGQRSRSQGRLTPRPKISHIFGKGRPTNFKFGILVEYYDPHHEHARWPQRSKVKVNNATSLVLRVFAHNSTKKSRRSIKIGRKVVRFRTDSKSKAKVNGHQAA